MEHKLLEFLKQQRDLAMQRADTHNLSEYNKKISLLEDYIVQKEQGLNTPLPYEFNNKPLFECFTDEILNQNVECFKESCTLNEFIAWFNDTLPEVFQNNLLMIQKENQVVPYVNLTLEQLDTYKIALNIENKSIFVYSTKDGIQYRGVLFMKNIDLYKICTSNLQEFINQCEKNVKTFEVNYY